MKITKEQLKQIIKEELDSTLSEDEEISPPEKVESEWQNMINWLKFEWENRHNARAEEREELAAIANMMMSDLKSLFSKKEGLEEIMPPERSRGPLAPEPESAESEAAGIIQNIRSLKDLGVGSVEIPSPELKAKILELAPDLASSIK